MQERSELLRKKAELAEEFRQELSEQFSEIIPHWPSIDELRRIHRVWEAILKTHPDKDGEMSERIKLLEEGSETKKIYGFMTNFWGYDNGNNVVWLGNGKNFLPEEDSICLDEKGDICFFDMECDEGGEYLAPNESHDDNVIITNVDKFTFADINEINKTIDSWYEARKFVNKYAYKLGVK